MNASAVLTYRNSKQHGTKFETNKSQFLSMACKALCKLAPLPIYRSINTGNYLLFFEFTIPLHGSLPFNTELLSARNAFTTFSRWWKAYLPPEAYSFFKMQCKVSSVLWSHSHLPGWMSPSLPLQSITLYIQIFHGIYFLVLSSFRCVH